MIKYKLKISDIIEEAKDTKTYFMDKPEEFTWNEGAHSHIGLEGFDAGEKPNKSLVRHMSIMSIPSEGKIGFTTRLSEEQSEFKTKLANLAVGDELTIFKIGSRMGLRRNNKPIFLLSMGVGIATIRPLILAYVNDTTNIPTLVNVNVDSSREFVYKDELDKLQTTNLKNYWLSSRENFYDTLSEITNEDAFYYIVGSDEFLKNVITRLQEKGINNTQIILDKKEQMVQELFGISEENK